MVVKPASAVGLVNRLLFLICALCVVVGCQENGPMVQIETSGPDGAPISASVTLLTTLGPLPRA